MRALGDHAARLVDAAVVGLDLSAGRPRYAAGVEPLRLALARGELDAAIVQGRASLALPLEVASQRLGELVVYGSVAALDDAREALTDLSSAAAHVLALMLAARAAEDRAAFAELASAAVESLVTETALPTVLLSPELHVTATNRAFDALIGRTIDDVFGKTLKRVGAPAAQELEMVVERVARDGRAERSLLVSTDHPWLDARRTFHVGAHPVRASSGEPLGVGLTLDEASARAAVHDAARLVADTIPRMVVAADATDACDALIAFSTSVGDASFVHLVGPRRVVAASFGDAPRLAAAEALADALGGAGRPRAIPLVLRTLRRDALDPDDVGLLAAGDPKLRALFETLEVSAALCVPIGAHGCLTIVRGPRPFDVTFGDVVARATEDVARVAAAAMGRARVIGEAHQTIGLLRDYASALSREVRDSVTALSTRLFLAERAEPTDVRGHVDALRKNVDRLRDALLRIAPPPAVARVAKVRRFALVDLVQRVLDVERARIARRSLELTTAFEPIEIEGDAEQLAEAARAILRHVIDAAPKRALVCVRVERTSREATVTISHTGAGFSIEEARRVFDAHWSQPDGRGRALVLARSIVEAHGGRAWIESAPDAGAAYCFAVPMRVSSAA